MYIVLNIETHVIHNYEFRVFQRYTSVDFDYQVMESASDTSMILLLQVNEDGNGVNINVDTNTVELDSGVEVVKSNIGNKCSVSIEYIS